MRAPLKPQSQLDFAEQALRTWGDTVFRVALGQTGSRADAEDICQDVFLRLLNAQTAFESDEHVKAWLIRVAINASRDLQRRQTRQATDSLEDHRAEAEQKLAQTGDGPAGGKMTANSGSSCAPFPPSNARLSSCSTERTAPPTR